jgi:predicted lipoprotein with Yx(FWY)xxD motif
MSRSSATSRSLLALATLAIVLAGCAGGAPPTDQPGAPQSPAPSPTAAAVGPTPTNVDSTPTPASSPTQAAAASPTRAPADPYGEYRPRPTAAASPQAAAVTLSVAEHPEHGRYLVGPSGHALYIFTQDTAGASNCSGDCASAWPPLIVEPGETPTAGEGVTGTLATIERSDGGLQVTYDDSPLYYFASDEAPGDTNGEGVGDVWFLAEP